MASVASRATTLGAAALGGVAAIAAQRLLRAVVHRPKQCIPYDINIPEVRAELLAMHERYEKAIAVVDFNELDTLFYSDPTTTRFGPSNVCHGHAAIAAKSLASR